MKRKFSLILLTLVLILILLPTVLSENNNDKTQDLKEKLVKERQFAEFKRDKLQNTELKEEILDIFRILDEQELTRVMSLSENKIFKLAEFKEEHIKKLAKLELNNLRKITSLDKSTIEKLMDLEINQLEKLSYLDRARINSISNSENIDNELSKIKLDISDNVLFFNKRIVSSKKIKEAEKNFQIAEQNLITLKKQLDSEKKLLKQAKESNNESGIREHSKRFLITASDAVINHLHKIKSKIQQSQNLEDEEDEELVKDIISKIQEIENIKPDIDANLSIEEIRVIAKDLNSAWKRIKIKSEFYVITLVNNKIDETIKRSEYLEKKLEIILTELEEKSLDILDIEIKLTEFSNKISIARINFKKSLDYFRKAKSTGIKKDLQQAILSYKEYSGLALNELRDNHDILKEIIKDIREKDKTVNLGKEISEVVIVTEKNIQPFVNVEIEGFLDVSDQKIINELTLNLNKTKTNSYIRIFVIADSENYELKREIKGNLDQEQKTIINKLVNSLENVNGKVEIKIYSGEIK